MNAFWFLYSRVSPIGLIGFLFIGMSVFAQQGPKKIDPQESQSETFVQETSSQEIEQISENELSGPPNGQGGWVIVEPTNILPAEISGTYFLIPYKIRRSNWGASFSVGYSMFSPDYYEPNVGADTYKGIYGSSPSLPLMELQLNIHRNFSLGSISLEAGAGMFQTDSSNDAFDSSLELIPVRLGLQYALDILFYEPYIVPYVSGGAYIVKYKESQGTTSFNGSTQVAPYATLGLQFQMDWIDPIAARISYQEAGIENTFLFLEGRKFFQSSATKDPNFETDFHANAGFRLQF